MMGSAAAFDMCRHADVDSVTLADNDLKRAREAAARINHIHGNKKLKAVALDASSESAALRLMKGHDAALSAVPYFLNLGLAKAAIEARCHFADLGGNNTVVRQELALAGKAEKRGVAIAPDCGLSPGMASILGGELVHRLDGRADALKLYVGGLPEKPMPPFHYQLVFSVEGLINEYVEPARILRNGKMLTVEPLTEPEEFSHGRIRPPCCLSHFRWNFDAAGNVRGSGRRMLREDSALSGTLRLALRVEGAGIIFQPEDASKREPDCSARADVENLRRKIRQQGAGRLHHATRSPRIRSHTRRARTSGRAPAGAGRHLHPGRSLRPQNRHERNDAHNSFPCLHRGPNAGLGSDCQAGRRSAGTRRSRGFVSGGNGEAWHPHTVLDSIMAMLSNDTAGILDTTPPTHSEMRRTCLL